MEKEKNMVSNGKEGKEIWEAAMNGGYIIKPNKKNKGITGDEAIDAITRKYGHFYKSGWYYHRGEGEWTEYSMKADSARWHGRDKTVQKRDGIMGKVRKVPIKNKKGHIDMAHRHLGDGYANEVADTTKNKGRKTVTGKFRHV